jgi:predicted Zn finger-like uncharacterized protein
MIVTCPNCEARYAVDPLKIGPAGRTVQCARCDNRWFQKVEGPKPAPDLVIRPVSRGSGLPAVIEPKVEPPWRRYAAIGGAAAAVIAVVVAGYFLWPQINSLIAQASASRPEAPKEAPKDAPKDAPAQAAAPAKPTAPAATPASTAPATPAKPAEGAKLEVDLNASKVELVDGRYVVHGEIVNNGGAPATTVAIKFTFKKNNDVVGEKSYPQKLGPIAPGARLSFSQRLDEPPAGTTDIVPAVE